MTIAISCSHCGQRYAVDPRAAGKSVTCKACGQKFVAQAIDEEDEMTLVPEEPKPTPARPAPQAARPAGPVARPAAPQPGVQAVQPAPASAAALAAAFGGMAAPPRSRPGDLSDLLDDDIKVGKSDDEDLFGGHGAPEAAKKKKPKKKKKKSSGAVIRGNEAGLLARWAGNFIDSLYFVAVLWVSGMLFAPRGPGQPTDAQVESALTAIGVTMVIAILVQAGLIGSLGQSLGKIALGTQIVNADDNDPPGFMRSVVIRWWLNTVLSLVIPFYALVDVLMIFGEDSRCLHDQIAGTRVISVR